MVCNYPQNRGNIHRMPIANSAKVPDLERLLQLFPVANIREKWSALKGNKDELCKAIAQKRDIAAISEFIDENLSCCKQHVYIFSHDKALATLPDSVTAGEKVVAAGTHAVYIVSAKYKVYLSDPLEEVIVQFLWPVRLELQPEHLVVRFIVLEKALVSYFDRPYHLGGKTVGENDVLRGLNTSGTLSPTDLHRGIKKLWADDFVDCGQIKFKKPMSVASEVMDQEKGIKKYNPELYKILRRSTLLSALFQVSEGQNSTVSAFSAEPPDGFLGFPRYTDKRGDTDLVIQEILSNN